LQATAASAAPEVGKTAPDFSATDIDGKPVKLSELRGKTVVLEWTNNECPYVVKHYGSGNMQALQRDATKDGVVWITLISSPKGQQGHVSPVEAAELTSSRNAAPSQIVLDETSKVARLYEAKTTPHMFVINPEGKLVFMGGIDDKPTTRTSDIATAKNYVRAALNAVKAGQPVATPVARPYGCSIKYAPQES
jgi:alkyl hydroperoxide reductase subunit AhpC